jgi:hypothetical protein
MAANILTRVVNVVKCRIKITSTIHGFGSQEKGKKKVSFVGDIKLDLGQHIVYLEEPEQLQRHLVSEETSLSVVLLLERGQLSRSK